MFIYQHVKAIHQQRFERFMEERASAGTASSNRKLGDLLDALAKGLLRLGFRDGDGTARPAGMAY